MGYAASIVTICHPRQLKNATLRPCTATCCQHVHSVLCCPQWEEWGNPAQEEYYHYMKSYAPVDNVAEGRSYPNILATGGLHDPRVACAQRLLSLDDICNSRIGGCARRVCDCFPHYPLLC